MTVSKEVFGLGFLVLSNILLLAVAWGRLTEQVGQMQRASEERLSRLEKFLGITDGEATFVRRVECPLLEQAFRKDVAEMTTRLAKVEAEVHAIRMEQERSK